MPPATADAFRYFESAQWLKDSKWYLAGGTALALQAGHRSSVDLDFFTTESDFSAGALVANFSKGLWDTDIMREGTLYGKFRGAKVSFIAYPFFIPREPYLIQDCVKMVMPSDIAVMKIVAVSQRGKRRDFVDLYWLCHNGFSLVDLIKRLPDQYPGVAHDYHHIVKALTYFTDAESDPMPNTNFKVNWPQVKKFFQDEAIKATHALVL